jgi:predicted nucleic acid-binding protein
LVTIVPAEQSLFDRAVELYDRRPDKAWSLTDCTSFTIMNDYTLRDALTGDHHFEQAGFNVLMK